MRPSTRALLSATRGSTRLQQSTAPGAASRTAASLSSNPSSSSSSAARAGGSAQTGSSSSGTLSGRVSNLFRPAAPSRRAPGGFNSTSPPSSSSSASAAVVTPGASSSAALQAAPQANQRRVKPFSKGQYYSPRTLSLPDLRQPPPRRAAPLLGPTRAEAVRQDPLHRLGLHPARPSLRDDSYKNPALLAAFVSEMGKIKPRNLTGLTRRSQREVGKAVRRARAMGLMPVMSSRAAQYSAWNNPPAGN